MDLVCKRGVGGFQNAVGVPSNRYTNLVSFMAVKKVLVSVVQGWFNQPGRKIPIYDGRSIWLKNITRLFEYETPFHCKLKEPSRSWMGIKFEKQIFTYHCPMKFPFVAGCMGLQDLSCLLLVSKTITLLFKHEFHSPAGWEASKRDWVGTKFQSNLRLIAPNCGFTFPSCQRKHSPPTWRRFTQRQCGVNCAG